MVNWELLILMATLNLMVRRKQLKSKLSQCHFILSELLQPHFHWWSNKAAYVVWEKTSTVHKTSIPIFSKVSIVYPKIPTEVPTFIRNKLYTEDPSDKFFPLVWKIKSDTSFLTI